MNTGAEAVETAIKASEDGVILLKELKKIKLK
jgi:acetylornithine/succinyldiaminopimelate/putrescine aminotransferase